MRLTATAPTTGIEAGSGAVRRSFPLLAAVALAAGTGYLMTTRDPWVGGVVVGGCLAAGVVLAGVNRLHVAVIPLWLFAPVAGALVTMQVAYGMSLVFDALTLLPLAALLAGWLIGRERPRRSWWGQALLWAFLGVAILQFANPDSSKALVGLQGFRRVVLPMGLLFVGLHLNLSTPGRLRRTAWVFVGIGSVVALWGLKQHFLGPTAAEHLYAARVGPFWVDGQLRIFSTFTSPWGLAAHLAALGLVAVSLALASRAAERVLALGGFVLFTVTLAFTYVRGPLMGYAVGLVFLLVTMLAHRLGKGWLVATFLVILGTYAVFVTWLGPGVLVGLAPDSVVAQRLASLVAPLQEEGMRARFLTWWSILPLVSRHPLGLGLGSTGGVSARFDDSLRFGALHTDNIYLATTVELGWLGGILFLALVLWVLATGLRRMWSAPPGRERYVALGILAYLIAMAVGHLATPLAFEPGVAQFYWLASGIVANPSLLERTSPISRQG